MKILFELLNDRTFIDSHDSIFPHSMQGVPLILVAPFTKLACHYFVRRNIPGQFRPSKRLICKDSLKLNNSCKIIVDIRASLSKLIGENVK